MPYRIIHYRRNSVRHNFHTKKDITLDKKKPTIRFENIVKTYPGLVALDDVNVELNKGEIHGLVGKNGAGKSTFVSIMYGRTIADSGRAFIEKDGKDIELDLSNFSPIEARKNGIYLVPQEPPFALDLTIEENFYLATPLMKNCLMMDKTLMYEKVQKTLDTFSFDFKPTTRVREVSMEDRHLLYTALVADLFDSDIVLLDEVTSALRKAKTDILFDYLNKIKNQKAIVLITHRIPEITEICDKVTVFRDGKLITTGEVKNFNESQLADLIVGETVKKPHFSEDLYIPATIPEQEKPLLEVKGLTRRPYYEDISFSLRPGEILGITGLVESGVIQLFRSLFGIITAEDGKILIEGEEFEDPTPSQALKSGMVYLTNDRIHEGAFQDLTILDNMNAGIWDRLLQENIQRKRSSRRILRKDEMATYTNFKDTYNIKATNPYNKIMTLSGGNQQKVVLARLAATNPKILVLDEPTKGIDVGAKYEILRLLRTNLIGNNKKNGIVLNSSSIEELNIVCDRILVILGGRICAEFSRTDFDENEIYKAVQGV